MKSNFGNNLALRNDSTLHRYPAGSMEYALRLAGKPDKEKKASGEAAFGLYPNPNDGTFTLSVTGEAGIYTYSVMDITGRQITGGRFAKSGSKEIVPVSTPLRGGIYLLGLHRPDGTLLGYKRMIIAR